jgi:Xaa-Pro dipeptidase
MKLNDVLAEVDAIYISNPKWRESIIDPNFFYFTHLLRSQLAEGALIILTNHGNYLITIPQGESDGKKTGFTTVVARNEKERIEAIRKIFNGKKNIGVSYPTLTVREFNDLKSEFKELNFVDVGPYLDEMRSIKTNEEITLMKEAIKITEDSLSEALDKLKSGMTEVDVAKILTTLFLKNGADGNAFNPIIAFGENSFEGHHYPGETKLKEGDFVLTDIGAKYMRYNSDITRTFIFGRGSEKQKLIHDTVRKEQEVGISAIKDGATGREVFLAMTDFVKGTEFKRECDIGTAECRYPGHGVGLSVHDHFGVGSPDWIFRENMVTTVEPGIYVRGLGGVRIEDEVLVKKNGYEMLSKFSRDYKEI